MDVLCDCCEDKALQFVFHQKPIAFCPRHATNIYEDYSSSESQALPISLYSSVTTRLEHEKHLEKPRMCVELLQTWEEYLQLGFGTSRDFLRSRIKDIYKAIIVTQPNTPEFISEKRNEIVTRHQLIGRLESFYQGVSELLKQIKDSFQLCFQGAVSVYTQRLLDWSPDVKNSVPIMLAGPNEYTLDLDSLLRDYSPQTYVDEVYKQLWFVLMIERHFPNKEQLKALSTSPNECEREYATLLAQVCRLCKLQILFLDANAMKFTVQDRYAPYLSEYPRDAIVSDTLGLGIQLVNDAYQIGVPNNVIFANVLKTFPEPPTIEGASERVFKAIKGLAILWESGQKSMIQVPLLPEDEKTVEAVLSGNLNLLYKPYGDLKAANASLKDTEQHFRQVALLFLKGILLMLNGLIEEGYAFAEQALKVAEQQIAKCTNPTIVARQRAQIVQLRVAIREILEIERKSNVRQLEAIAFWLDYSYIKKTHRENCPEIASAAFMLQRSSEEFKVTELFHKGKNEEAETMCTELLHSDHHKSDLPIRCCLILGLINRQRSRFIEAEGLFLRAIELAKEKISAYQTNIIYHNAVFLIGNLYVEMERYKEAEANLKQVAESFARSPTKLKFKTKMRYATLLRKTSRCQEAENIFQQVLSDLNAVEHYDTNLLRQETHQGLMLSITNSERTQESLYHFRESTGIYSFDLYLRLGNEHRFRGKYQDAERIYQQILTLDKPKSDLDCTKLQLEWATLCLLQGRFGAVYEHCNLAFEAFPSDLRFHSELVLLHATLACSFYAQQDMTRCSKEFQAAFQICSHISDSFALDIACTGLKERCDVVTCVSTATSVCKDVFAAQRQELAGNEVEVLGQRQKTICEFLMQSEEDT